MPMETLHNGRDEIIPVKTQLNKVGEGVCDFLFEIQQALRLKLTWIKLDIELN